MNRREMGNATYARKFNELGLSETFEFMGRLWSSDHGRKVSINCRQCGHFFESWAFNDILKGKQSRLICPKCGTSSNGKNVWHRSRECDEAMAYYMDGHTVKQTAEKFGVSINRINNAVKVRQVSNGRYWGELSDETRERLSKEAEGRVSKRLETLGFDYLGGYTDKKGSVRLRCQACGDSFERTVDFIRRGNLVCRKCEHEKALARQAERKRIRAVKTEQRKQKREVERMKINPLGLSSYQLKREKKMDEVHVCKVCGEEYTPRQYMEDMGLKSFSDAGYCSAKCRNKAMNAIGRAYRKKQNLKDNYRHRAKMYGCEYDSSVTLKRLVKRDGLLCAICGKICDWDDHSWSEYSGPTYPSVDHIIPMSRGGGHIWNNVQVVHMICNSYKGNKEAF